ncbi:DUF2589 domain-containing protein [Paraneptunicella aestuarii]|uniref:DUF2589 domain-containing protein n=1 Tax=Paraneptunicella aestuarii TaxID=2831148 RepID=UPI001E5F3C7C|nr:DUF2589 domain-containing protein [Paraneptunicella aestuarii]UAA39177.1 DUF2589 domain-containing protein [Paraneptunicella aestuarii]
MTELVKMSDQFGGLPMGQLIGAPLTAACDAQISLAKATSDFIETVGFVKDANNLSTVRMVPFSFEKPEQQENPDGTVELVKAKYTVEVPFISIVTVPTLQVTEVDVNFMMEVKSSFSEQTRDDKQASMELEAGGGIGPFSVKVTAQGSISSSKESQRSSDNSAKYDVSVRARSQGTPEGLSRVLDILQQSIAPVPVNAKPAAVAAPV